MRAEPSARTDEHLTVPAGDVRSAAEAVPVSHLMLEQAARTASFRLWAPLGFPAAGT